MAPKTARRSAPGSTGYFVRWAAAGAVGRFCETQQGLKRNASVEGLERGEGSGEQWSLAETNRGPAGRSLLLRCDNQMGADQRNRCGARHHDNIRSLGGALQKRGRPGRKGNAT